MTDAARRILEGCIVENDFQDLKPEEKKILVAQFGKSRLKRKNSFLGSSKDVVYKIFDLPRKLTCYGRTPICEKTCYQVRVEKMHKGAGRDNAILICRKLNWFYSLQDDFVERMVSELRSLRPKANQEVRVRIHASGDFYSYEYLKKWFMICLIMRLCEKKYIFVAYTKSFEFLDRLLSDQDELQKLMIEACVISGKEYQVTEKLEWKHFNIHIIASVMDDTKENDLKIIEKYSLPKYIVTTKNMGDISVCCDKIECAKCSRCYVFPMEDIYTRLR